MPRRLRAGLLAAATALSLACASRQRVETALARALVSEEQENQIALQVKEQLRESNVRFVDDPAVAGYVERVAEPILALARKERPDLHWHVHVIDDARTVNAFATTGGHMYVYTGLLLEARDGAELAGVVAHEAAHVALYHVQRQLVDAFGLQALASVALGNDPATAAKIGAAVAGQGVLLAHGRASEREADAWGVRHAARAGYDPHGIVRFFERLRAAEGEVPRALRWLRTHPAPAERVADVRRIIDRERLGGGSKGPGGLEGVQARIRSRAGDAVSRSPR